MGLSLNPSGGRAPFRPADPARSTRKHQYGRHLAILLNEARCPVCSTTMDATTFNPGALTAFCAIGHGPIDLHRQFNAIVQRSHP